MNDERLDQICDIIQEDVGGRGLRSEPDDNLITTCAGDFHRACRSLAETKQASVAIVTGFYIATAKPPCGETDGPLGALFLARDLLPLGMRVVLVTDGFCTAALQAGLEMAGIARQVPLIRLPEFARSQDMGLEAYWDNFRQHSGSLTHLLTVERVGPNHTAASMLAEEDQDADEKDQAKSREDFEREVPEDQRDRCFSMRGRDITAHMSPAHWLLEAAARQQPPIVTIGIGDGGNELGMGKIPWNVIRRNIPRGGLVACRVPVDHLIVSGISNWGAYGLAAGVRILMETAIDPELFNVEREQALLQEMVLKGPLVDGVSGLQQATVDGLEFARYAQVLRDLAKIV
jgi:D-glutamate cyclase